MGALVGQVEQLACDGAGPAFLPVLDLERQHLLHALHEYERFYDTHRHHEGTANARPLQPLPQPVTDQATLSRLDIRRRQRLGGILDEYHHAA